MNLNEFWNKEIFAVDGLRLTIGVIILIALVYWLIFMRR